MRCRLTPSIAANRWLTPLFALPFLVAIAAELPRLLERARPEADFTADYGVNEWMINYAGGFGRRGIPGALLLELHRGAGWHPAPLAVWGSVLLYGIFCLYLWRATRGLIPRWGLLTTPLLAAPLYLGVVVRKEVLLVLLLAASLHSLRCPRLARPWRLLLANLAAITGVLSHELYGFIGLLPPLLVLADGSLQRSDGRAGIPGRWLRALAVGAAAMAPALLSFALIVRAQGTLPMAWAIHNSWRSAWQGTGPWPERLGGSILHIPVEGSEAFDVATGLLRERHGWLPTWLILLLTLASGVVLVAALFQRQGAGEHARAYLVAGSLQALVMGPVFLVGVDFGRWILLVLLSALVLVLEAPALRARLAALLPARQAALRRLAGWPLPLALLGWGNNAVAWTLAGYLFTTPLGNLYANLRALGWLPSANLL